MIATGNAASWKRFGIDDTVGIFMVDGSRVYDLPKPLSDGIDQGDPEALTQLEDLLSANVPVELGVPDPPNPQSISLNVSSSCNLSCAYCYAGRGGFSGAQTLHMKWPVAKAAVDKLLDSADRAAPITIGFIGGEPFVNARLIHQVVQYAARRGSELSLDVRFSVTTNATLLKSADLDLLRNHPFAVTVSLDGGSARHQEQRPGADFEEIAAKCKSLLADPGLAKISARATISRGEYDLTKRFDDIRKVGFLDIGFAPVRTGVQGQKFELDDWKPYLAAMTELARRELEVLKTSGFTAFSNFIVALRKIRAGSCSPYPCGAGGGYFSVAASGDWYACHRAIGDDRFRLGTTRALDPKKRLAFLNDRNVSSQIDCQSCWARYLCSGSCHQESEARSPESCDFIRGWLEFCLTAYLQVSQTRHVEEAISNE